MLYLNLMNSSLYFFLCDFIPNSEINYSINVILPQISYSFFFIINIFNFTIYKTLLPLPQRIMLFFLAIISPLLMIMGHNSMLIFVCFIVILVKFMKMTKILRFRENFSTYSTINQIAYCCFFFTGHRNQLDSIKMSAGFIGFTKCHMLISGLLIGINTYSSYIIMIIIICYKLAKYQSKTYKDKISKRYDVTIKFLYLVGFHIWGLFATCIHCLYNYESLLLVYEFMPKFLLDTCTFLFINGCLFILQILMFY